MLSDAAGVEQDDIGLAGGLDRFVARFDQGGGDQLAVEHVHLAADRLDVKAFGHFL
jgi:hypothetical protein